MADKYNPPQGPPPTYPAQVYDAGPAGGDPRAFGGYGSPPPLQYGSPAPYLQGPYGPPQQGYGPRPYGQQQPMYYQQQPYGPQGYPPGVHDNRASGAGGICAGILGAFACCCCLDMLI